MSRTGLRQLVLLLVLASLAGGVFWLSSLLHQRATLKHDLQRQHSFAGQLAGKLQQRLQQGSKGDLLADLVMDVQQRAWVINAGGKPLYPADAELSPLQERALSLQHAGRTVLVTDELGFEQMTSVVAIPGTDWQLMLQMPANGDGRTLPSVSGMLIYLLPAAVLLILLAWFMRPLRLLAGATAGPEARPGLTGSANRGSVSPRKCGLMRGRSLHARGQQPPGLAAAHQDDDQLDPVTGLSTPDILPELVANISLSGMGFTAVTLAVDDYEQIQDHFPQELRDQAFKRLAGLLLQNSRELDISVRMGEEVFLLLLPQCPPVIAERIAERLRSKVQDSFFEGIGYMTISVGIAGYQPGHGEALETLKQAQQRLIAARREGHNLVRVADSDSSPAAPESQ